MTYSEQLEREAEHERAEIQETLEELRARLKPGQLIDQLMDYARDGTGGQFYANLKRQVVDNPLPVTVIGAGLAWLALSSGMSHRRGNGSADSLNGGHGHEGENWYSGGDESRRLASADSAISHFGSGVSESALDLADSARGTAGAVGGAIGDGYRSATDAARRGADSAREAVVATSGKISEHVSTVYGSASDAAGRAKESLTGSMSRARRGIAEGSTALADFSREQPLVVAAIGVAIGAALGAALPSTTAESRVMGDASDNAKARVRDIVDEQTKNAKHVAEDAVSNTLDRVQETASSALDRMDRDSEQSTAEGGDAENARGDNSGDDEPERGFRPGDRPSNG